MAAALKLISHKLCPYVQRAVIALSEKGVPFERIDIDLANKPDWFLKISPLGKVPVLVVTTDAGEVALFESNVICEYHRGDPGRRKAASAGSARTRAAPRLDGVRLRDLERSVGTRDHDRCRRVREQAAGDRRKIRAGRGGAGRRAVLRRTRLQPGRCGVRADLPLFRQCSTRSPISASSRTRRKLRNGGRSSPSERAFRPLSEPIIRICCAPSSSGMTRIS